MSRIFVTGLGAVSPAGWNVAALREVLKKGEPLPVQSMERPGWDKPLRTRLVPAPASRPDFLTHPRLRRSSPITHYAAAAAVEAMAGLPSVAGSGKRLGVVVCVQAGCVRYSCRFLDETMKDPATASPLLFPETVYAAPASHAAALLENVSLACSIVGDPGAFLDGVSLAVQWLEEDRVDACLVIGAEETNWILADALRHLDRNAVLTSGAGAICLSRDEPTPGAVELSAITDAHTYSARHNKAQAARAMRAQLPGGTSKDLLCDGLVNSPASDAPEQTAWTGWPGERLSPKHVLGEGLMASAAWQCVAACDALMNNGFAAANVSLVGSNQQAIGARFVRAGSGNAHSSARG
jgi:3-oxoacyl-(acyl-carrier-protein) synthase